MNYFWAAVLLFLCFACTGRQAVTVEKPNVIVILTDDQGYGDLSCLGNPVLKTPNLDQLYEQSVRLTDFHVAPVCTPTRGQLLSGRDAMHNGAWSWAYGHEMIHQENTTMADIFRSNGYRTGHFGKWHLGDNYPYRPQDKGFDETVNHGGAAIHQSPDYWQNDGFDDFYKHIDGTWKQHKGYCTDVWFNLSMDFMKRCSDEGKPFFLYLPTNAPHGPHYVEEKYSSPYKHIDTEGRYKRKMANFFGMIANFDENMGRLEAFLRENSLGENTILIFMTDNGGTSGVELYNAGMRGNKGKYYDGGHRVPCFIRWPDGRLEEGLDINELVQVQDLLPTLIDLCELDCSQETMDRFDGVSLAGLITGSQKKLDSRKLVVQWSPQDYPEKGQAAVLWKKWRLVHGEELYNLAEDPAQEHDVAQQHPGIVDRMQEHYEDWWESVHTVVSKYSAIGIGGDEDPVRLCCFDWTKKSSKTNVTQQTSIWQGALANGSWKINVESAGQYRFELRRYPREADFAISGAYPEVRREYREFPECKALPVKSARLKVGEFEKIIPVGAADKTAVFELALQEGELEMKTWFIDPEGNELCGAYYVDVHMQQSEQ